MVGTPAFVLNGRLDVLASNELGRALYAPIYDEVTDPPNNARFIFLNPRATQFWSDWDKAANDTVAMLRDRGRPGPYDRDLSDLVGELSTRSDEFRVRWADHNVRLHVTGRKAIHHPTVGDLDLPFEFLPLPGDPGQSLLTYTAEPGSPSARGPRPLGAAGRPRLASRATYSRRRRLDGYATGRARQVQGRLDRWSPATTCGRPHSSARSARVNDMRHSAAFARLHC